MRYNVCLLLPLLLCWQVKSSPEPDAGSGAYPTRTITTAHFAGSGDGLSGTRGIPIDDDDNDEYVGTSVITSTRGPVQSGEIGSGGGIVSRRCENNICVCLDEANREIPGTRGDSERVTCVPVDEDVIVPVRVSPYGVSLSSAAQSSLSSSSALPFDDGMSVIDIDATAEPDTTTQRSSAVAISTAATVSTTATTTTTPTTTTAATAPATTTTTSTTSTAAATTSTTVATTTSTAAVTTAAITAVPVPAAITTVPVPAATHSKPLLLGRASTVGSRHTAHVRTTLSTTMSNKIPEEAFIDISGDEEKTNQIGNAVAMNSGASHEAPGSLSPPLLAAIIGGGVVGLLCTILLIIFIVYRMRRKDEGSYPLDDGKPQLAYAKPSNREFYA